MLFSPPLSLADYQLLLFAVDIERHCSIMRLNRLRVLMAAIYLPDLEGFKRCRCSALQGWISGHARKLIHASVVQPRGRLPSLGNG